MQKKGEDKLAQLFDELRLQKYLKRFQEEEVIYEDLRTLSDEDLEDLIPKLIPRRRLIRYLAGETQASPSSQPNVVSRATSGAASANISAREPVRGKKEMKPAESYRDPTKPPQNQAVKPLSQTEKVLVQGLVQTPHLNGIYLLNKQREINGKVFYRKRMGKAVLSWQQKPQWKVLKNGDWITPAEGTGIWYISHDFESDLMVYVASSEDCPFIKPRQYDGVIWEWHERKEQWVKAKAAEIAGLQHKVRIKIDKLETHRELNGTYEMELPEWNLESEGRPWFVQVEPHKKGILHWEIRKNFQVLKNREWVKPDSGVGLWVLSPVENLKDMRMYFGSNELMPFFNPLDYDGCKWEWVPKKSRFDLLKNFEITRLEKFERQEVTICGIAMNRELNGTYVYDGITNEGKQVYKKSSGTFVYDGIRKSSGKEEAFLFWTHKEKWSVRINKTWRKPEDGVGIWNLSKKIRGKILCYFASNEAKPWDRGDDYDQVVWEWNSNTEKWNKVKDFEIKIPG